MKTEKTFSIKSALVALFMLISATVMAQTSVTGTVIDDAGEAVIGATVRETGTQNATVTDFDGNFLIRVSNPNAVLNVSYVGFQSQEVKLGGRKTVAITMKSDDALLNEVVVVGYGTMKKKLVTGATVEVKGEQLTKLNTTEALGALQSQTPGVNIQSNSGQPGDGFKVTIRGAGTNGSTTPLYVIDGVSGGDINNINPADIERIDVLKDAASCAIYGSAAANGVILITTKHGHAGSIQVSYDGSFGIQNIYRLPQMLTAKQYMQVMDQTMFNSGEEPYNWTDYMSEDLYNSYMNGSNTGTNWIEQLRNKDAITTSHALNIAGGSDKSTFSLGLGYQYQDGIMGGDLAKSDYSRFTIRLNSDHVLLRSESGRDIIKVGENLYFRHRQSQGIQIGNQYSNVLSTALRANPLIPVYNSDGEYFGYDDLKNSGMFNYSSYASNPVMELVNSQSANNESRSYGLNAVGYVEISPIKGLTYRGQVSYNQSSYSWRCYLPIYKINDQGTARTSDSATDQTGLGWGWNTTNTLNYVFDLGKSNFDILVGTEYGKSKPSYGFSLSATASGATVGNLEHAYMDYMTTNKSATVSGSPYGDSRSMSYFGRVNYNYDEKYMLSAIIRADGSSVFAPGHRWGYFPSVSGGWVISNEKFMKNASSWLNFLKLRAGWGQNGNKNISAFQYEAAFAYDAYSNYSFNNDKETGTSGASLSRLANEDLTWETSEQINVGLDAHFLRDRLTLTADWYQKTTKDLILDVPVSATTGFKTQKKNAGTVRNRGVELALNWNSQIGKDFTYNIGVNGAYNQNEVTKVNSSQKYNEGGSDLLAQGTGIMARFEEGQPIGYFYGYKTDGVIQNTSDLAAYQSTLKDGDAANSLQGSSLKVGDLKFHDNNGDGVINSDDKTYLGDPNPDFTLGVNLGFNWKGLDFSVTGYGAFGQQVARSYRKFTDGNYENFTTEVYSYWNGEGTSNKYPQLAKMNQGANWQQISDIYIENASYFRIQNIALGYDFSKILKSNVFDQLRLYVSAQNLWTFTNYKGMDPENGTALNSSEPWVTGVDVGNYPHPRTYTIGVNVKFSDKKVKKEEPKQYMPAEPKIVEKVVEKIVEKPVEKIVYKEVEKVNTEVKNRTFVVNFPSGKAETPEKNILDEVPAGSEVEVVAYASPDGNPQKNIELSQKRADSVAEYLKAKGIKVNRTEAKGSNSTYSNRIAIVTVLK